MIWNKFKSRSKSTLYLAMIASELQNPDKHYVSSAQGWLSLGNTDEAELELANVGYWSRLHPDVLMVRWKVLARRKQWGTSLDIARTMIRSSPDRPSGYICLAYSLCHSERDQEAKLKLVEAHQKFPKITSIAYFLARLNTKLGCMKEASQWLNKWNKLIESPEKRHTARKDPKLKSLWAYLGEDVSKYESETKSERKRSEPEAKPFHCDSSATTSSFGKTSNKVKTSSR